MAKRNGQSAPSRQELARLEAEVKRRFAELAAQAPRTEAQMARTEAQVARTSAEVGKVSNGVGYFAKGLVAPSVPSLLRSRGIHIDGWSHRVRRRLGGDTMEVDMLAVGKRNGGAPVAVVVEVSTQLLPRDAQGCAEKVPDFFRFYPEYRDHEIMAGVAGMAVKADVVRYAERRGLFVFGPGEEIATLLNHAGFRPKVWRAGR